MKWPSRFTTLVVVTSACYWILFSTLFTYRHVVLPPETALAIYSSEIQFMAIFAGLSPIFVAFIESTRSEAYWGKIAALYALCVLTLSAGGVGWCLVEMGAQRFDIYSVFEPAFLAMASYFFLAIYLIAMISRQGSWRETFRAALKKHIPPSNGPIDETGG